LEFYEMDVPKAAVEAAEKVIADRYLFSDGAGKGKARVLAELALQAAAPFMQQQWLELQREGAVAERELGYHAGIEAAAVRLEEKFSQCSHTSFAAKIFRESIEAIHALVKP
jgi:hypothetical protein